MYRSCSCAWWLGGRALDFQFIGHGLNFRPVRFHITYFITQSLSLMIWISCRFKFLGCLQVENQFCVKIENCICCWILSVGFMDTTFSSAILIYCRCSKLFLKGLRER